MSLTIVTTYNTAPKTGAGRITAKGGKKQVTKPYDHALSAAENHKHVMLALLIKMEKDGAVVNQFPRTETIEVDNGRAKFVVGA